MHQITRRDFLKIGSLLAASAGLSNSYAAVFADGLVRLAKKQTKVLWLQGQSCSGCTISLLNSDNPSAQDVITDMISLIFNQTISAAQGRTAVELIEKVTQGTDSFVLMIEGSIPYGMPEACLLNGKPFKDVLAPLLRKAQYVVGVGSCATYGGLPAAEGNLTGAISVKEFMEKLSIPTKDFLVNLPSCPAHSDPIIGTLAYLAGNGYPKVHPELLTPDMYFAHSTHDDCPRFHYYNKHIYAKHFGDQEGCLFKLGCLGMLSFTECPRRQWNSGVNWCIRAAAPCTGCSHPQFGRKKSFPFYRKGEFQHEVAYAETDRKGGNP